MQTPTIVIEYRAPEDLTPNPLNPRTHSAQQIRQVAASIRTCGFINPIIVDGNGQIVAGHARYQAAHQLKLTKVPVIQVDHLSPAELRAYILADNKLTENAGWDKDLLRVHLEFLTQIDIDVDLEMTGFSTTEIDLLIQPLTEAGDSESDVDPPSPDELVTQPGDLWLLGPHRLYCGDCRSGSVLAMLMDGRCADMVFTDPPYNVKVNGHISGTQQHGEFAMGSGELSQVEFEGLLTTTLHNAVQVCRNGAVVYVFMDWRHQGELLSATRRCKLSQLNLCVWVKSNGGMGSLYRSQHELVGVYKVGTAPHRNNVELGKHGRYRTNVWQAPGMNAFGADRDDNLAAHPTVKPVSLIAEAILDVTARNDVVLDPFMGSGSTLLAAEKTGRIGYGVEIDPRYVDVAIRRWQALTGETAVLSHTGQTFDDLAEQRQFAASDGRSGSEED